MATTDSANRLVWVHYATINIHVKSVKIYEDMILRDASNIEFTKFSRVLITAFNGVR